MALTTVRKPFRHNFPIQQPMSTSKSGDDRLKKILVNKYNSQQNAASEMAEETNNSNFESAYKNNLENNYTNRTPDRSSLQQLKH